MGGFFFGHGPTKGSTPLSRGGFNLLIPTRVCNKTKKLMDLFRMHVLVSLPPPRSVALGLSRIWCSTNNRGTLGVVVGDHRVHRTYNTSWLQYCANVTELSFIHLISPLQTFCSFHFDIPAIFSQPLVRTPAEEAPR